MNSSLALSQGDKLNGTVKLNVTYNKASHYSTFAILTTTDIPDKTNREKLAVTPGSSSEIDPIRCSTVDEMKNSQAICLLWRLHVQTLLGVSSKLTVDHSTLPIRVNIKMIQNSMARMI